MLQLSGGVPSVQFCCTVITACCLFACFNFLCAFLLMGGWKACGKTSLVLRMVLVTPGKLAGGEAMRVACPPALIPPALPASRNVLSVEVECAWMLGPLPLPSSSDEEETAMLW